MKICIIHGSPRKGNTYKTTQIFLEKLKKYEDIQIKEHFVTKEVPDFCTGCFTCFLQGEEKCPHANMVQPILEDMLSADGIIFTSPVYVMSTSAGMKNFLDHLGYLFIVHRPEEKMFEKVAMIISTTAGAGTNKVIKTIKDSLDYWGMKRVRKLSFVLYATKWSEVNDKKRKTIEKVAEKKAKQFYKDISNRKKKRKRLKVYLLLKVGKLLQNKYPEDSLDRQYWKEKGWIS